MTVDTPILDLVRAYAAKKGVRLHVPGHKGTGPVGAEPFDITEIAGADSLYEADGIIQKSEENAARLFGTAATFYSTEGSSHAIRAMLKLCLERARGPERPLVLAARNAHKAFLYAAALLDLDVEWLYPERPGSLCACPIAPKTLQRALEASVRRPICVYVTSPDYLGGLQDIGALSKVCHARGVPLVVDNAHGAYLRFLPGARHPMELGADLCCDSAHKTLPVLTGGAYLHVSKSAPASFSQNAKMALSLFGSTSPSYLTLLSLDAANAYLAEKGEADYALCAGRVSRLRALLEARGFSFAGTEPLKLTLTGDGRALAQLLRERDIEPEYADARHAVLMFAPGNTEEDFRRVAEALPAPPPGRAEEEDVVFVRAPRRMTIRQAMLAPCSWIKVPQATGRVCASPAVSCPPAIPIAVSGEEITKEAAALFERCGIDRVQVVEEGPAGA